MIGALLWGCGSTLSPAPVVYGEHGRTTPPRPATPSKRAAAIRPADGVITVRRGDTLYHIARYYRAPLRDLIQTNGLKAPYRIYAGQRLRLPDSRFHVVGAGETLHGLARRYDVDSRTLVQLNDIAPPYRLKVGQRLRVPDAQRTSVATEPASPIVKKRSGAAIESDPAPVALGKPPPRAGRRFLWPVRGRVIVAYGPQGGGLHNDGINILAAKGAAVRAAENGVVAYTGNELRGFGKLLLIKHAGGWMTAYAHNDALLVKTGQVVRRGQPISRVGNTGSVSRAQLHFELRRGQDALNPIKYLAPVSTASLRSR